MCEQHSVDSHQAFAEDLNSLSQTGGSRFYIMENYPVLEQLAHQTVLSDTYRKSSVCP